MMQYPSLDGTQINAYLSRPAAAGRYPGVIVIMEAFGLNDHIKDVARRFAEQGYCALAPDMYTREGAPDPTVMEQVLTTMFSVPDTQAVADLEGAITYLKGLPESNGKVGAIGFCSGGRTPICWPARAATWTLRWIPLAGLFSRPSLPPSARCRPLT